MTETKQTLPLFLAKGVAKPRCCGFFITKKIKKNRQKPKQGVEGEGEGEEEEAEEEEEVVMHLVDVDWVALKWRGRPLRPICPRNHCHGCWSWTTTAACVLFFYLFLKLEGIFFF